MYPAPGGDGSLDGASRSIDASKNGVTLETRGYGSFRAGAEVVLAHGPLRLELGLSDVPGVPVAFVTNAFG